MLASVLDAAIRFMGWLNDVMGTPTVRVKRPDGKTDYYPYGSRGWEEARGCHMVKVGVEWGVPIYRECYCDGSVCGTIPRRR